uniref:Uncharacterized protein n=1 Tax=viral metagenome TaxID=1070528 RepID=A0A6C0INR9_9ZZZZ
MSLLVHKENQELLWTIANKNKAVTMFFQYIPQQDRYTWFQQIIGEFYNKYKTQQIGSQDLRSINREILTFMIENASSYTSQYSTPPETSNENLEDTYKKESKKDDYMSEFEKRQHAYENMNQKEQPKEVKFSIDLDPNNESMENLIKKQQEERNIDLQMFPTSRNTKKLKLLSEIKIDAKDVVVLDSLLDDRKIQIENLFMQQEELISYKQHISYLLKEVEDIKKILKNKSE